MIPINNQLKYFRSAIFEFDGVVTVHSNFTPQMIMMGWSMTAILSQAMKNSAIGQSQQGTQQCHVRIAILGQIQIQSINLTL